MRSRSRVTVATDLAQPHRGIRTRADCCDPAALGIVLAKVLTAAHGCSGVVSITNLAMAPLEQLNLARFDPPVILDQLASSGRALNELTFGRGNDHIDLALNAVLQPQPA